MHLRFVPLLLLICIAHCSSPEKKLYFDGGQDRASQKCGTESYLNKFAFFTCSSLELEDTNDFVNEHSKPLHNIRSVVTGNKQALLVIDEKLYAASAQEDKEEVVCTRRLKVILNPGTGDGKHYQEGWCYF